MTYNPLFINNLGYQLFPYIICRIWYTYTNKSEVVMENFIKATVGLIAVVCVLTYILAAVFAPFGIVWLILAH